MEVFRWVVDLGSFSRAADRLDLSNATVTAHVAALENRLGIKLLNRTTRRLALTDDGTAYLDHVRRVLADVEETESMLAAGRTTPRGILRVDLPTAIGRQFVVPALPRFTAQYPEVRVVAILEDRRVDFFEEGVDAALRIGPLADSSLIARRVYEASFVTCASPDYLALHGTPQTPADLAGHQCLGLDYSTLLVLAFMTGVIRRYRWTLPAQDLTPDPRKVPPEPRDGLRVCLHQRTSPLGQGRT